MTNTNADSTATWPIAVVDAKQTSPIRPLLQQLVDQQVAVIVIKNLINEKLLQKGLELVFSHYERKTASKYHNGTLTTIGPYLVRHLHDLDTYFAAARTTDEVFENTDFDLRKVTQQGLRSVLGLRTLHVEQEPDGRRYADSIIRIHGDGVANPLHNDHIMRDSARSGLKLAKLTTQLSCVVCLQECDNGGELITYQREWSPQDEKFKIQDGLGYHPGVIKDAPRAVFRPQQGDVYLINPTTYHEIARVGGKDRVTLSFFMGFYDNALEDCVLWS